MIEEILYAIKKPIQYGISAATFAAAVALPSCTYEKVMVPQREFYLTTQNGKAVIEERAQEKPTGFTLRGEFTIGNNGYIVPKDDKAIEVLPEYKPKDTGSKKN